METVFIEFILFKTFSLNIPFAHYSKSGVLTLKEEKNKISMKN